MSDRPESEIKRDAQIKQDQTFIKLNFNNQDPNPPRVIMKSIQWKPEPIITQPNKETSSSENNTKKTD